MYLIFDTETTGLPKSWNAPITNTENWPRCIQIAWQLHDGMGSLVEHDDFLIQPEGFNIPYDAEQIHGISTELVQEEGISLRKVLVRFNQVLGKTRFVVGQNVQFDLNIIGCEFHRLGIANRLSELPVLDTCTEDTAQMCQILGGRGGKFKWPTLTELHNHLFGSEFINAHNATADVEATSRCFFELIRLGVFSKDKLEVDSEYFQKFSRFNLAPIQAVGLTHINLKRKSEKIRKRLTARKETQTKSKNAANLSRLEEVQFAHLHTHTQFSILQSTIQIERIVKAAAEDSMSAVAITDSGNMMGCFHFVNAVIHQNRQTSAENDLLKKEGHSTKKTILKPIVGCEFNVCENHLDKANKDNGYQIVFLAKNKNGYHNLAKMSSIAFTEGFYYVPRIDRKIIEHYTEDLIVLTGGMRGELPSKILNIGEKQAEEALLWWKEQFADDLYIELTRHHQEDERIANETLLELAKKHTVKVVAANNIFYLNKEDANAHDILLCVKEGEKQATPIGRGRGYRYGLPNQEYYFKTSDEMKLLFADLPEAIINTQEIVDKIEVFSLKREVLLPAFDIPSAFRSKEDLKDGGKRGENNYLKHLAFIGAKRRYGEITATVKDRLDFELNAIKKTGYPGYFLIVEDLIKKARNMSVSVGPGRGSAAGSVVAYCLWITNIDPIKYNLLFERFLNPERISMPDIDIDFDDEGRGRVMDYVIKKYGGNQVAQIITYGTMAAKSSIRDTARVLDLPLYEADRIAKLIPNIKLKNIFGTDDKSKSKVAALRMDEKKMVNELKVISKGSGTAAETVNKATIIEGSLRSVGTHACGVIITPSDITNYVPVALAKDSDMYVTQFDNSVVESAGLLKMDFLGLKTLTLIRDTVKIVKARYGTELDPEHFPLDDSKTYQLFQRGETIGIFQYESTGMQKHMRTLKPTVFDDLIAMNALYRPGPMEYIPSFIRRKHGQEKITYDLPEMEEYLAETYGITIYQEQVMLLSQKLANFSRGEADVLRKAMGKKQAEVLKKMKPKFIRQASICGHEIEKLEKIWKDWEAFASYAFNKSHSTCYAWIAYQTAYLKANYPAEYMASVLSNNMGDIKSISFFMEECKSMGLKVLGPDINESYLKFSVNSEGAIRFGMGAIKGVGNAAVRVIVQERKKNGPFVSIFDLCKRIDLRAANKKTFDGLILAGGFDSFFNSHRSQYFAKDEKGQTFIERAIRYGHKYQENLNSAQLSLFSESSNVQFPEPEIPQCEAWGRMEELSKEKEVVGIYISAHPLDDFKNELTYCNASVADFKRDLEKYIGTHLIFAGILTEVQHRVSKVGKGWASFTMEDYHDSFEFRIFGEDYLRFKHFLVPNSFLFVKITIQKGWTNKEGMESNTRLKYTEFKLLHDVMDDLCKKITIKVPLKEIHQTSVENFKALFRQHKGKQSLRFLIYDSEEKIELEAPSRNTKVKVNSKLLKTLEKQNIRFKLD